MMGTHGTREQAGNQNARVWIPRARPAAAPDHRPRAGHDLLSGVESVLAQLTVAPNQTIAGRALADDLKAALARTAACGDTCRVRAAADSVRMAVDLLLAGSAELAMPVLLSVRAELSGPRHAEVSGPHHTGAATETPASPVPPAIGSTLTPLSPPC